MEVEIFIGLFCACVLAFLIYLGYVYYLKKYRGYRYEDGIPDVAILRRSGRSNMSSTGLKHFAPASFRASQISTVTISSEKSELLRNSKSPLASHIPASTSRVSNVPTIYVEQVP